MASKVVDINPNFLKVFAHSNLNLTYNDQFFIFPELKADSALSTTPGLIENNLLRSQLDQLAFIKKFHSNPLLEKERDSSINQELLNKLIQLRAILIGCLIYPGSKNLFLSFLNHISKIEEKDQFFISIYQEIAEFILLTPQNQNLILPTTILDHELLKYLYNNVTNQGHWQQGCKTILDKYFTLPNNINYQFQAEHNTNDKQPIEPEQPLETLENNIHDTHLEKIIKDLARIDNNNYIQQEIAANLSPASHYEASIEYKIYTKQFDQTVHAAQLVTPAEKHNLFKILQRKKDLIKIFDSKLTKKLIRILQTKAHFNYFSNASYGLLDSNRLSQIIASKNAENIYRESAISNNLDTCITLLIDNSGSMRGKLITIAALTASFIAEILEPYGIKVEILGFTTKEWRGGKSKKMWQQNNAPITPGRLNDLLHIVYKSFADPLVKAKKSIAIMLKEGLLKENIDGEALLWSYQRILKNTQTRKIIMVISDGTPLDEETCQNNPARILEDHLHQAINLINCQQKVELVAIGIGHDISKFYAKSTRIDNFENLGNSTLTQLIDLFK
ncbi:cobaltochelatase CobT-related protein [Rickettsiales endosymbiont of Stachyamoeba lipophora]|uniref:cobaltochelatase CobT-related protein n=1 Tax=Rickettsiales endosymbiont of Stachyamoeba lipophora TaxID=2486578 RepID=UPI000F654518|nr:hypothetical protein [Rickettsiales endosymbiont of Stachyamoeba lipophora]AZL15172.1 hypothetical protein EF513_01175 [Rickettsiales endosymbiont of Stachyamoeba lipophora]